MSTKPHIKWQALLILPLTLVMAIAVGSMAATNSQQADQIQSLSVNSDALREQVKDAGETPVAPPAKSTVAAVDGQNGSQGLTGLTGDKGAKGDTGPTGLAGSTGLTGESIKGDTGANGLSATGVDGADGSNGSDGANGADGVSVTGPAGTDGANGANGVDGQPVYSWSTTHADGTTETCNRADPFDPAAPTYTCAFAPTVTPAP